jgi:hypothetical protein
MGISSSAVLVELNVSNWGASKLDRNVTDTVNINHNATRDASKVYKNLVAGSSLCSDIAKYAARIRLYHNEMTLPWTNKGARLLPVKLTLEYKQHITNMRIAYENMCNNFYAQYPSIVANARTNLQAMFKAEDYPTLDEVKEKFGFSLVFSPLPESGDFRLDVANEDLKDLQDSYEADFNNRLAKAVRAPWEKLYKELQSLSSKLDDSNADPDKKKRYHDSLLENPQELCRLLTALNVTNDPKLEEARRDLERVLIGVEMEDIKESELIRSDVKARVDAILEKFDW